jgi:hypothetical protein
LVAKTHDDGMKRKSTHHSDKKQLPKKLDACRNPVAEFFSLLYKIHRRVKEQKGETNEDREGRNTACKTQ